MSVLTEPMKQQIRDLLPRYPTKQAVTLPALHIVHETFRCVPYQAMAEIAELLEITPAEVHDTMSFYGFFREEGNPLGKHRVWVCRSLSCMLRGGEQLLDNLCDRYHVKPGGTTTDGKVTLEFAECLGACEGAPCILVNDDCYMNQTPDSVVGLMEKM